ncbi:AGAP004427-PA [Anopheles gambiae str. PEST]|uniref:AGAP004427-PA n=1 Tax=Anopheles gambiae TaxID=7165 RepID=A0NDN7_ANOGA|nr:AGAP004427-PA [Anopheles gambiae str. PEST]
MTDKRKEGTKKTDDRSKAEDGANSLNAKPSSSGNHRRLQEDRASLFDLRTTSGQILFIVVTVAAVVLVQCLPNDSLKSLLNLQLPRQHCKPEVQFVEKKVVSHESRPKYWVFGRNPTGGHLLHVHNVLQRLGIDQTSNDTTDWDLLWAHDYPFRKLNLQRMKRHQLVNHFPGSGYITNKVDLSTTKLQYIPAAFKLPAEMTQFREYAKTNPHKQFVQKHNQHRHIQIKRTDEIDFSNNDTFIQEFIDDPLLVDGYKFDIGVYTVITSIDPLRVYIYKGDILFRYCPVPYHPFNASDVDKYIVDTEAMLTSLKNLATAANLCSELPCTESCAPVECQLCSTCLEEHDIDDLQRAYREHMNRGDMKRIFPVPKSDQHRVDYELLSAKNQFMSKWFEEKCKVDQSYC